MPSPTPAANRHTATINTHTFPTAAGIWLGLGLGGFVDGIVFHQILQLHHMVSSAGYPPTSLDNLQFNVVLDGLFHAATWVFVVIGLFLLWRASRKPHGRWPTKMLIGTLLMGFGLFNTVEGIINHHLLGIHHVNETVPQSQWIYWDIGFLISGVVLILLGWMLWRAGRNANRWDEV